MGLWIFRELRSRISCQDRINACRDLRDPLQMHKLADVRNAEIEDPTMRQTNP